jgi:hypothetical protein
LHDGFVFDRVLIVAAEGDGGALAAWLEGVFVGTGDLVVALVLSRVEAPRRDHTDLALLQCDAMDGLGLAELPAAATPPLH